MEVLVLVGGEHVGPIPSIADNSCVSVLRRCYPQRGTSYRYTAIYFQPSQRCHEQSV
jgi:hypothetical protein